MMQRPKIMSIILIVSTIIVPLVVFLVGCWLGWLIGCHGKVSRAEMERQIEQIERQADRLLELSRNDAEAKLRLFQDNIVTRFQNVEVHFRELTETVLKERSAELNNANGTQINALLTPFRERLDAFSRQVGQLREASIESGRQLRGEILTLNDSSRRIGSEAERLASALSVGGKSQGLFGERRLGQLLAKSGLKEGEEYFLQHAITDDKGRFAGDARLIPDAIVQLPERNVMLIIDSKASFTEYLEACNSENDEATRRKALRAHVENLRRHIKELSAKDYAGNWRQANSKDVIECVMMFVPNDAALQAALDAAPDLWSDAYRKGVVITGPANLIIAMKMVEIVWQRVALNDQAGEILNDARKLLDEVKKFRTALDDVGNRLQQCTDAYGKAVKALGDDEDGKKGIAGVVRHLVSLGAGVGG